MAANLTVKILDKETTESINLEHSNEEIQPTVVMDEAVSNSESLHEIIDDDLTIKDPGCIDLEQISALQNIQPNSDQGKYVIPVKAVSFSADDKKNLKAIIEKLASVCHTHTMETVSTSSSTLYSTGCTHERTCSNCDDKYCVWQPWCCADNGDW